MDIDKNTQLKENSQFRDLQKLLSLRQAANLLSIANITLYRLVESNRIEYRRIGRRVMFDPEVLRNYGKVEVSSNE